MVINPKMHCFDYPSLNSIFFIFLFWVLPKWFLVKKFEVTNFVNPFLSIEKLILQLFHIRSVYLILVLTQLILQRTDIIISLLISSLGHTVYICTCHILWFELDINVKTSDYPQALIYIELKAIKRELSLSISLNYKIEYHTKSICEVIEYEINHSTAM